MSMIDGELNGTGRRVDWVKLWDNRRAMLLPGPASAISSLFAAIFLVIVLGACGGAAGDSPETLPSTTPAPTLTPDAVPSAIVDPSPTPPSSPQPFSEPAFSSETPRADPASALEGAVQLPHDEGVHLSPLEWWYFNGHLTTESGREFSYHFVTFQLVLPSGLTPRLAQLSWADHDKGLHLTEEQADVPSLEATSGEFDLPITAWRMSGDGDTYHLSFRAGDYTVDLESASQKPAVLHHGTGLVDLGVAGKSYYYSRTDLETSGTVSVSGVSHSVTGVSWMDHQWGAFTTTGIGWDWLSLNLDDGSDLMVSMVWEQAGPKHIATYATYVPADSAPVYLGDSDVSLDPTGTWTSSVTGAVYPMGWKLRVDSLELDLTLTPAIEEAEFSNSAFTPVVYWEGAVAATGTKDGVHVSGRGFVEMVGYAPTDPSAQSNLPVQP